MEFSAVQIALIFGIVAIKVYELSYFYCVEIPKQQQQLPQTTVSTI